MDISIGDVVNIDVIGEIIDLDSGVLVGKYDYSSKKYKVLFSFVVNFCLDGDELVIRGVHMVADFVNRDLKYVVFGRDDLSFLVSDVLDMSDVLYEYVENFMMEISEDPEDFKNRIGGMVDVTLFEVYSSNEFRPLV